MSRYNDDTAAYEGLAVDLCTAVAVGVVGRGYAGEYDNEGEDGSAWLV